MRWSHYYGILSVAFLSTLFCLPYYWFTPSSQVDLFRYSCCIESFFSTFQSSLKNLPMTKCGHCSLDARKTLKFENAMMKTALSTPSCVFEESSESKWVYDAGSLLPPGKTLVFGSKGKSWIKYFIETVIRASLLYGTNHATPPKTRMSLCRTLAQKAPGCEIAKDSGMNLRALTSCHKLLCL